MNKDKDKVKERIYEELKPQVRLHLCLKDKEFTEDEYQEIKECISKLMAERVDN